VREAAERQSVLAAQRGDAALRRIELLRLRFHEMMRENGPSAEPGVRAEESRGPDAMNDPVDPDRTPVDDAPDADFEAALRAAFGPPSTAAARDRCGVLEALRQSTGVTSRVLLRDEPDAPAPVVGPGEEALLAGDSVRYQVLGEIARGGMGVVLKGRDPDLGRDVAIKVLHPGHAGDQTLVRRFVEEAQIGGQLQHPGILPVYELGLDARLRPYFTMRLVKGRTLAALLEERPDPAHDRGRFLAVFEQVCQAVAYAHARGVIHRDLKPSNIMVGAFGEVQVVDWGLSKVLRQGGEGEAVGRDATPRDEPQVTTIRTTGGGVPSQSGSIVGTPSYMSPEQARGEIEGLDEQADVFALGATLCEILTGQPPYVGSRAQILEDAAAGRLDEAFARLDSCGAEGELIRLAARCLDPSRGVRPRHAAVLAREVTAFLASVGDRARAAEVAAAEARATAAAERRARRRTAALTSALGLAIMAGATFAILAERERRTRAEQSIASVAALFRKADWFRDQARRIPPDQLDIWERALAQVRRTAEIVGAGAIDEDTRKHVVRLLDELRKEEQSVRERARQHRAARQEDGSDWPRPPRQDQE
jgi:serine/threonine-protein kinase